MFLVAANLLRKPNSKKYKKQNRPAGAPSVLNNLICGFKDFVKPQSKHSNFNRNSFYDYSTQSSSVQPIKRSLTPDLVNDQTMNAKNKIPSSVSSPNLAKQDSGSSTSSSSRKHCDLINLNEDYDEKKMDENRTPKSKKRSILPSTILSLEDRDLVVIDKQDIKEAVSHESKVIIVDPPPSENEHVDLSDILAGAGDWPELQAGGVATLLNSDKKGIAAASSINRKSIERNKSANIASHFSNSKPRFENGSDFNVQKKSKFTLPSLNFI